MIYEAPNAEWSMQRRGVLYRDKGGWLARGWVEGMRKRPTKWEKRTCIIETKQTPVDLSRGPELCVGLRYVGRTLVQAARPTERRVGNALCYQEKLIRSASIGKYRSDRPLH